MKFQVSFLIIGALAALPAMVHHSFNAEYDRCAGGVCPD